MRMAGVPVKEVMEQLNIRNKTQVKTWMKWYRSGGFAILYFSSKKALIVKKNRIRLRTF